MSKNLDELVRLQSEKREEWIQKVKRKTDYEGQQQAGAAHSTLPTYQPRSFPEEMNVRVLTVA